MQPLCRRTPNNLRACRWSPQPNRPRICPSPISMVSSPPILFQFGCWLLAAIPCGFATELLEIKSKESSLHVLLLAGNPDFFNGHFSFTTFNCEYDQNLASSRDGVYTFKAHGQVYHRIHSFGRRESDPKHLELYFYDDDPLLSHRMRLARDEVFKAKDQNVMTKLANLLRENPYAETFRSIGQYGNIDEYRIDLNTDYKLDQRTFNTPTSSEVAAVWVEGTELHRQFERGVTLYGNDNAFYSIKPHHGCYDPLAYPLFFPRGELGWHSGIPKVGVNTARIDGRQSTDSDNPGLMDSVYAGEHRASALGKLWVLPASFIGGPRDMRRRYMDAFALVQKYGKPDIFLTMTCNPNWEEITSELEPGQKSQDRCDLVVRVFKAKLDNLKHQLFKKHILGVVAAHVYVIEFQKRGLPHAHFLLIMQTGSKLTVPDQYDAVISAELPDKNRFPELFDMVVKHMMHGPCGHLNMQNTCMKNGSCKCHYPRLFGETTLQGKDSYPIYRRRDDRQKVRVRGHDLDNRWVVPYNPTLLRMYDCHINVEVCSSIKAVKYIYKYIHKGHDRASVTVIDVDGGQSINEIENFRDARWVSPQEALWRIYSFDLHGISPPVLQLQLHLPGMHLVSYNINDDMRQVLNKDNIDKSMLTEYFRANQLFDWASNYLYREFPEVARWWPGAKKWTARQQRMQVGRIVSAHPAEGERYYLRVLLNHVRGATSFESLRTYDGNVYPTFREAAEKRGLIEADNNIDECLTEASGFHMPPSLRRLFATILVFCEPTDVVGLWNKHLEAMSDDFCRTHSNSNVVEQLVLLDIRDMLQTMGKDIRLFPLPAIKDEHDNMADVVREIFEEMNIPEDPEAEFVVSSLNHEQRHAYDVILSSVENISGGVFFVDGPGGTGKTFLYKALLATVRRSGKIAIATATSGVAASIMPGGRTAHSRFKIPLNIKEDNNDGENIKDIVGNVVEQSLDVVAVGNDPVHVSAKADVGEQPNVTPLSSLDVQNESTQISSDVDTLEQIEQDNLDTLIRICEHNKPKKLNVARVLPKDYTCTTEDLQLIEYIKSLPRKQVVVNIDTAWLNRYDMECLFHGDLQLTGEASTSILYNIKYISLYLSYYIVLSAYIHSIRDEEHILHREGGKVFLESTFISSLLKRDGDPKILLNCKEDTLENRVDNYLQADMVFIPINIENFHWYLAIVNAKKNEVHILDSMGPQITDRRDLYTTVNIDVTSWPVIEKITKQMQTDGVSCGLWMVNYMEYWTGSSLSNNITQNDITKFRFKLPAILWNSRLNTKKGHQETNHHADEDGGSSCDVEIIKTPCELPISLNASSQVQPFISSCALPATLTSTNTQELMSALCTYIMEIDDAEYLEDLSGFLVINFMHSWNGKRLPCISTTSSVLRTKFLVELMKYQDNECNDNIPEEIQKIIKRISV
ncbi:hypothetical protein ZEAMMB73_Zm00001d008728 [Zea mays]|uniref:ATP-dependent DNA helicase n=1 Tax=Zea mays TaxID=4577 RepID=A0A1D6FF10_MAIZE|nr:hypothetical protein ZEAMMB73_Zm00001d008728 [Zea mays]